MIRSLKSIKAVATVLLLTLPMLAFGQNQSDSVVYIDQGDPIFPMITYYHAIPGRFFIQKSDDVSQEYIISLLDQLTDATFQYSWHSTKDLRNYYCSYCRIIIDDSLIDYLIEELLKDDGILTARRIYVDNDFYNQYIAFLQQTDVDYADYFKVPNLNVKETVFSNQIICYPSSQYRTDENNNLIPMDSICNNLAIEQIQTSASLFAQVSKNADVFEVAQQLLNTGYFNKVDINRTMPFAGKIFDNIYGAKINRSDHFFQYNKSYNDGKLYYHEIQGRFFVEKNDSVTHDYINELLDNAIDGDFESEWLWDDICRVIVNEELIDNIIDVLLKDDGIKTARRIYVSRNDYCNYLFYPDLEQGERYLLNIVICYSIKEDNQALLDSISNSLDLTYSTGKYSSATFNIPKHADIFEAAQKIFETGGFGSAEIYVQIPPKIAHWGGDTYVSQANEDEAIIEKVSYYNMLGRCVETPSGLTIVVTRYSDGSVRTEKKLFR